MTGSSGSSPASGKPARRRPFPFGLVMLLFGLGLGFYGGVAATKRAMTASGWIRQVFGIPETPSAPASPAVATNTVTPPAAPATTTNTTVTPPPPSAPSSGTQTTDATTRSEGFAKKHTADTRDLVGTWETTDSLNSDGASTSSLTTAYIFRGDTTGEFDSNGKKLYEFKWKSDGADIAVEFDGEGPDANQPWNVKLNWSLNADQTVLTLIPTTGKDPRSFVYSLGPGVYRKKSL